MKAKINGITINYELSGRKSAPAAAFSHSLGASASMWEPQLAAFEKDFHVLRWDTRGHGESGAPPGPYSFEHLAEDFIGLLDTLGIDRVHFIGLSMGGMIGQALGLCHPDRLLKLCLCDTAAATGPEGKKSWEERIAVIRREGLQPLLEATMARWFTPAFLAQNPPILQKIRKQFLATPPEGFIGCVGAIRELSYLNRLSEITVPALVVVGEDDPGTPVSAARAIHERIAGSQLSIIPGARHLPNVEKPEEFNAAVIRFLS
jgi:3-oxoadipate enol-lactonase